MRGFRTKGMQRLSVDDNPENTPTKATAAECDSCSGGAVRTAGQENAADQTSSAVSDVPQASVDPTKPAESSPNAAEDQNATVVMKGPMGHMFTEALNRLLTHENSAEGIAGHSGVAVEELAVTTPHVDMDAIYANGMMDDPARGVTRITKAIGVIPTPGEQPTALNTMLDALQSCRDFDVSFVMINQQITDPNGDARRAKMDVAWADTDSRLQDGKQVGALDAEEAKGVSNAAVQLQKGERPAIESIEIVVRYR